MMGTTMDNPSCEWIRGRLPLGMGAGDGLGHPADEAAVDLGVEERRSIERHLAGCPGCRRHRSELAGAGRPGRRGEGLAGHAGGAVVVAGAGASDRGAVPRRRAGREGGPARRRPAAPIGVGPGYAPRGRRVRRAGRMGRSGRRRGVAGRRDRPGGVHLAAGGGRAGVVAAAGRGRGADPRRHPADLRPRAGPGSDDARGGGRRRPRGQHRAGSRHRPARAGAGRADRDPGRADAGRRADADGRRRGHGERDSASTSSTSSPCRPTGATPGRSIEESRRPATGPVLGAGLDRDRDLFDDKDPGTPTTDMSGPLRHPRGLRKRAAHLAVVAVLAMAAVAAGAALCGPGSGSGSGGRVVPSGSRVFPAARARAARPGRRPRRPVPGRAGRGLSRHRAGARAARDRGRPIRRARTRRRTRPPARRDNGAPAPSRCSRSSTSSSGSSTRRWPGRASRWWRWSTRPEAPRRGGDGTPPGW